MVKPRRHHGPSGRVGWAQSPGHTQAGPAMNAANTLDGPAEGDGERRRRPATRAVREHVRRRALPRMAAFWLDAGVLASVFFTAGAPSPLYDVYRAQWHFSAATLTAVFAI